MITTKIYVTRHVWTRYGDVSQGTYKGSGYCEEHYDRQYLIKGWYLWGWPLWRKVLDSEDVPLYVAIQKATLGQCDWKSKFKGYIT